MELRATTASQIASSYMIGVTGISGSTRQRAIILTLSDTVFFVDGGVTCYNADGLGFGTKPVVAQDKNDIVGQIVNGDVRLMRGELIHRGEI